MLFTNLSVLLAERGLRISKVASDIGASRTTITALCNNTGQGVQFDTLNRLCNYLKISPAEFFIHIPYDYQCIVSPNAGDTFNVDFTITHNKSTQDCPLIANVESDTEGFTVHVSLIDSPDYESENRTFKKFFSVLPPIAVTNLEEKLLNHFWDHFKKDCPASIVWEV